MVLPPSKRQKAPKKAWTRCPGFFQSLRVQQVAPTSLCKGGKKVYLFYSARFSHFVDSQKGQLQKELPLIFISAKTLCLCHCLKKVYKRSNNCISITLKNRKNLINNSGYSFVTAYKTCDKITYVLEVIACVNSFD